MWLLHVIPRSIPAFWKRQFSHRNLHGLWLVLFNNRTAYINPSSLAPLLRYRLDRVDSKKREIHNSSLPPFSHDPFFSVAEPWHGRGRMQGWCRAANASVLGSGNPLRRVDGVVVVVGPRGLQGFWSVDQRQLVLCQIEHENCDTVLPRCLLFDESVENQLLPVF